MICSTCGRENADHLVFCQECGQRLAPRVAPPTPPIGLSSSGAASAPIAPTPPVPSLSATAPIPPPAPSSPASAAPRPQAPDFKFSARPPGGSNPPAAAAPQDNTVRCPTCGSTNQRGLRFCVTCGQALAQTARPEHPTASMPANVPAAPAPPPPPPAPAAAPAFAPSPPSAIAPARVLEIGGGAPAASARPSTRACPRCRGANEAGAQFCKYCGAAMAADGVATSRAPAPPTQPQPAFAPRTRTQDMERTDVDPQPPTMQPATPAIDAQQYRAYQAMSAASSSQPRTEPTPSAVASTVAADAARGAWPAPQAQQTQQTAPAAQPYGRLVVIARDGGEGPSYPLADSVDIGRTEGTIVVPEDRYISPRHARIARRGGVVTLKDLGSVNGIYLRIPSGTPTPTPSMPPNVRASQPPEGANGVPLQDQDLFLVGQQVLRFEVVKDAEEGYGAASQHGTLVFGTPAAPRYARLSQRTVEGVSRDVFYVRKVETVLGRESGDIVFTEDPFLSRRHAMLRYERENKRFLLADLGSSNGTFLQIREEVRLKDGDHFRIGQQLFRIDLDARALAS